MKKTEDILKKLTLEEKASLCSGSDFWHTQPIERLGIPAIMLTDGPHGLRKQSGKTDHLGINKSVPATCFPSGAGLASSWDRELIEEVGSTLGKEAASEDVAVLLGPGANIKRTPICGRNFEYYSEDPVLSSQIAKHFIKGVQSQGVGTSIKHFVANNQEYKRMSVDTLVDERTLREIYLASFETAIRESSPYTIMSAYNQLNGEFCSDNHRLLTDILHDEWGYEGLVVSDWGAEHDRVAGIKAGMDLEMPGNGGRNDAKVIEAIKNGDLTEADLDKVVTRILELVFKCAEQSQSVTFDKQAHDKFARKVAGECIILLKNNDNLLPISSHTKAAVIGELAKKPRYQGGGSSHINPTFLHNAWDAMNARGNVSYAQGYALASDDVDVTLQEEAIQLAKANDVVLLFAGLPDRYESEGYDRKHLRIPSNQIILIEELSKVNKNIVVVLSNGSAVEMPWIDHAKSVVESYLGGQAGGSAVVDVLYGDVNPSGKLAETFPIQLEDNPTTLFMTEGNTVAYSEGIYIGYRYYDAKKMKTLFPFGHGLSYTTFDYKDITLDTSSMKDTDTVTVTVTVKNTGEYAGKEVVQLYVRDMASSVKRPVKELKEFAKVYLAPNEEKTLSFQLGKRAFAYYNVAISDWYVESGDFEILVGSSSAKLPLREKLTVESTTMIKKTFSKNSSLADLFEDPVGSVIVQKILVEMTKSMSGSGAFDEEGAKEMASSLTLNSLLALGAITEQELAGLLQQLNA